VHIADVSWFVPAGSPLDHGAAGRAFSTYVPGLVAPMLPPDLADDACSLRPHQDRLTVTVEIPPAGGETLFYRSVISSNARLTYGQAERREAEPVVLEQLALNDELASELRRQRFARGALAVQTPELEFRFGDGRVTDALLQSEPHSHMLVEELMILANEHVAAFLAGRNRAALYRVHERPDPQSIELLLAKLADLGVPTPPAPDVLTPQAAAELAGETSRRVTEYTAQAGRGREAFPALVLRALKQARYDPRNLGHSGLASRAYCHFTSPIRRYPDLVVHRALLRELGQGDDPVPEELDELAEHTSARERAAAQVEYTADELCLAWLLDDTLRERGWQEPFTGEITGLIGSGLFARFGEVFEGFLPARRLPGEFFELNATGTALVGRRSGRGYRLGDAVEVRVESIARHEGKVELAVP
jgi:ribonuclease R